MELKRYFYKNYGGQIIHQFKGNGLKLVVHEAYFDNGVAYRPISECFVRFWYVKKIRKKIAEGNDVKSLNEYLIKNNIKLLDEANEEVIFQ